MIPPIIGYIFVPETLGMRQKDFKEEKLEEKYAKLGIDKGGESEYLEMGSSSSPSNLTSRVGSYRATTVATPGAVDPDASERNIL